MKGKLAFVLGVGVGYVLGTRAGRERYEQIKRAAESVWQTPPVQRGVGAVREAAQLRVDELKGFAKRVGADAVSNLVRTATPAKPAPAEGAQPTASAASTEAGAARAATEQTGAGS